MIMQMRIFFHDNEDDKYEDEDADRDIMLVNNWIS